MDKANNPNLTDSQRIIILDAQMSTVQNRVIELDSRAERIYRLLVEGEGGNLPVLERVRNLEAFIGNLKFWLRTVAVAIVLQTLTFAVTAAIGFLRILPLMERLANNP